MHYFHSILGRLISNLVVWFLIYICLRNLDGSRISVYRAEEFSGTTHEYSKSFQHVQSEISCAKSCARYPYACKAWYYNSQEETCHIQTDQGKKQQQEHKVSYGQQQWRLVNPTREDHCRVPFVKNVTSVVGRITIYDGTVPCEPCFCFFERKQADECRRTESRTKYCGECKQIEWRNQNGILGATLPAPVTLGWKCILKVKLLDDNSGLILFVGYGSSIASIKMVRATNGNHKVEIMVSGQTVKDYETRVQFETFEIQISFGMLYVQVSEKDKKNMKFPHNSNFSKISGSIHQISLHGTVYAESMKFEY